MDFVNKAYVQTIELFRSMSPATRIATGLLAAVIVVSLVYLFQYQVQSGDEFLLDGRPFSASEMTAIEAAFAQAGLNGSLVVGNRIRIPRGQKAAYLAAMADASALPADFYKYFDDAVSSENPFASNRSLELKHANAKMKELALIISRMQGIQSATVQFDEEPRPGLARSKDKTAMVAVWTSGASLDEEQVKAIRNVVSSAYAGLDRHSITITDMTNHLTFGGPVGPDGVVEGENYYATFKLQYERDWQRKIRDQLSMIPGVKVNVNVELSSELAHMSTSLKLDPKPVAISSSKSSRETTTQLPNHGGRPGALPNGVGNQPVAVTTTGSTEGESTTSESHYEQKNVAGHEQIVAKSAPLAPKKVSAAIDVPASYYAEVWRQRNPNPAGQRPKPPDSAALARIETETKKRIQETVRNLLPPVIEGTSPYPHIIVSTYTDLPTQPTVPPTVAAQAKTWLADNWPTLATIAMGCFCLLIVRSMVRSTAGAPPSSPASAGAALAASHAPRLAAVPDADEELMPPTAVLRKRFQSSGPDLRAELHELVKENPDAAARVLRMWIGDAA
jgi:flagellar M-ring protein FliF